MRFFCLVMALCAFVIPASAESGRIVVTGHGQVQAVPDMAVITLGVSHEKDSARAAIQAVAETSGAILKALTDMEIEARDMQTSELSLSSVWDRRANNTPPRVIGYSASNQITVQVRELERLGDILGKVTEQGANRFQGLRFALQDPQPVLDEARRAAVADGQRRATLYAGAAGVTLGPLVELREGGSDMPRPIPIMREAMAADMAMPVAEGELSLGASVTMVYEIAAE